MKYFSWLFLALFVPLKCFSYGYVSNVSSISSVSGSTNTYTWDYTMSLLPSPSQPGTLDAFNQDDAYLALAIYNNSTGKYYQWLAYSGPNYDLSSAVKPLSIDRAIFGFFNDTATSAEFEGMFLTSVDFENSCMNLVVMNSGGDILATVPGGTCTPLPVPDVKCETSGDLTLNHGTISSGSLNGNTATGEIKVTCTDDVRLNVSVTDHEVTLADNLVSDLYVNDTDMSSPLTITDKASSFTLTVKSILATAGTVEPGSYTGSTVMIISPY